MRNVVLIGMLFIGLPALAGPHDFVVQHAGAGGDQQTAQVNTAFALPLRVVVTDASVAPEEPPNRETLTLFLLFQIAARDTGCFPDVGQLKIMQ